MLPCGMILVILVAAISAMTHPTSPNKDKDEPDHPTSYLTSSELEMIYMRLLKIPILYEDPLFPTLYAQVLSDISIVQESILDNWCERCLEDAVEISYLLPNIHLQVDRNSIQNYKALPKPSQPYYPGPQTRRYEINGAMHLPGPFQEKSIQIGKNNLDLQSWILDPFYVKRDQYYEMRIAVAEDAWFGIAYRSDDRVVLPFGLLKLSSTLVNIDSEKNIPRRSDRSVLCSILRGRSGMQSKERVSGEYGFKFHNPFIDDVWFPILFTTKQTRIKSDYGVVNRELLEYPCALAVRPVLPTAHDLSVPSKAWEFADTLTSHPILIDISYHPAPPLVADTFWVREQVFRSGRNTEGILANEPLGKVNSEYDKAYEAHWNDWVAHKLLETRIQKGLRPLDYGHLSEAAFQVPLVGNPSFKEKEYLLFQKLSIHNFRMRQTLASVRA